MNTFSKMRWPGQVSPELEHKLIEQIWKILGATWKKKRQVSS
ncbi:MAG: hypothetical protein Q7K43_03560 [Candidatus Woesearchaeota archaeon]|nr:hypothetical protein [Candidatus Woesearchaeota archaeon]